MCLTLCITKCKRYRIKSKKLVIKKEKLYEYKQTISNYRTRQFFVGGNIVKNKGTYSTLNPILHDGQTFHGDHAYVSYQIPENPHRLPLVFLHGAGQSGKTWESTPDGREGFGTIFLRRGFATYILDQPRRGVLATPLYQKK